MTIIRYQVFPSVRLSFFSINSLISSGFPLASFHLAEPKLETGTILKNWKPLFRLPLIAKRCAGANVELKPQYLLFRGWIFLCVQLSKNIAKYFFIYIYLHVQCSFWNQPVLFAQLENANKYATTTARTMHVNDRIQNKNKILSYSNWACFLLFDLARKQCNGIIKGLFHCLTTESKGEEFLSIIYY